MKPSVAPRTTAATTPGAVGLVTDPAEELAFLSSEHVLTYAGEWVAIVGAQVVAHGPSLEKVRQQALTRVKGRKPTYFAVPAGAATYRRVDLMPASGWGASYPFVRIPAPKGAREQGFEFILAPLIKVELANLLQREKFYAIVDSGADYSYLPSEAAKLLGLDAASLSGSTVENRGIGALVESKFATLGVSVLDERERAEVSLDIPFLVPLHPDPETKVVLLGRHPFFRLFDVRFRMGYTDDPSLGKWSLTKVVKHRDSSKYRKPAPFPRPPGRRS